MKNNFIKVFLLLFLFTLSCYNKNKDDCNFKVIPLPETMYIVTEAGLSSCNGEYRKNYLDEYNGRTVYHNHNSGGSYHILYDLVYGWSISSGAFGSAILYYSNSHTDEPPGDSLPIWQSLSGADPPPYVESDIYYYQQLIGNCL